jgi:hypothetical protein
MQNRFRRGANREERGPIVIRDPKTIASIRNMMRETGEGFHALLMRLMREKRPQLADKAKRQKKARFALARRVLETRASGD